MADFIDMYNACTAGEAKKEYFLTTKDLQGVPFESQSFGFGTGRPTRWYSFRDLEAVALAKHGAVGLAKKRLARKTRQANQKAKELAAQKAKENLEPVVNVPANNNNNNNNNSDKASAPAIASAEDIQKLRKAIVKALKSMVTYDYMRKMNAKDYFVAKAQIPRVARAEYAALIGRPTDVQLTTVVKKGAWYNETASYECVLGKSYPDGIIGSGGRYGCNSELGIDPGAELTVRYKPSDETLSVDAIVQRTDLFGFD